MVAKIFLEFRRYDDSLRLRRALAVTNAEAGNCNLGSGTTIGGRSVDRAMKNPEIEDDAKMTSNQQAVFEFAIRRIRS